MRTVCAVDVVRAAEATTGVAEPVLMQRAATALAGVTAALVRRGRGGIRGARIVALVGSGNNGGDALWALAFLARRGARCMAVGEPAAMHREGSVAARAAGARLVRWSDPEAQPALVDADLALDGIVGIGGRGALREPWAGAVRTLADARVPIVAVDVPSGVDSDTGEVAGPAVRAIATVCFGVLKPGLVLAPGRDHAGAVTVVDIGLRAADLQAAARMLDLPDLAIGAPDVAAHKYRRGLVAVAAGSPAYPGAALLAVGGARRAGAGMVTFTSGSGHAGVTDPVAAMVVARFPDVVLSAARAPDSVCVGPGLGPSAQARDLVLAALAAPAPVVLDASGLAVLVEPEGRAALEGRASAGWVTVLTPHAGEFARLGFATDAPPLRAAVDASRRSGAVLVRKGPGTIVAAPSGSAYVDSFGTSALATAGSGDVLAGLIAGLLAAASAQGPLDAGAAALLATRAVGLHGLAGRLAGARGAQVTASDVLGHLAAAQEAAVTAVA